MIGKCARRILDELGNIANIEIPKIRHASSICELDDDILVCVKQKFHDILVRLWSVLLNW